MPGIFDVLGALYEVSTIVTDVILNGEYIERGWTEEYALSIAFLVFNGVVMAFVGLQIERRGQQKRYVDARWLNAFIGAVIGLLQLRVLAETVYMYIVSMRSESADTTTTTSAVNANQATNYQRQQEQVETKAQRLQRLKEGLVFAAFVQAMVRDMPVFVIQANATIHYRKWELVDLWAVSSTGVTLLNAVSSYVTNKHTQSKTQPSNAKTIGYAATLFLLGQFVFRLGAILLVATTTGSVIVFYSIAITVISIVATVSLKMATPAQATSAQVGSAVLFFPLFTVFSLDASYLHPQGGSPKDALYSGQLLLLNAWRVLENTVGVVLAATLPRYTDFGASTDQQIAIIGLVCGVGYAVTLVTFIIAARSPSSSQGMEEDTTLYLQNNQQGYVTHAPSNPHEAAALDHPGVRSPYVNPQLLPKPELTPTQSQHIQL